MRVHRLSISALVLGALLVSAIPLLADTEGADAILKKYADAYNRHDAVALAALYTEDALLFPPDAEIVRGREAIEKFWNGSIGRGLFLKVMARGIGTDVGYLAGDYDLSGQGGSFTVCLRRGHAGNWQIAADIWNARTRPGLIPAK